MIKKSGASANRYSAIVEHVFAEKFSPGMLEVPFARDDLTRAAKRLHIVLPKNLGDVLYSVRYRTALPASIRKSAPKGQEWTIEGKGRANYSFVLATTGNIVPQQNVMEIKIPDSTPEIVGAYALTDEQALLAKVRYNRLVDIFLGIACYSLQNHLRTSVKGIGQVEVDEIYVGVDRRGCQYVVPVQAKGGKDRLSVVQVKQDLALCKARFPQLVCRAIGAQFVDADLIALFELVAIEGAVKIVEEKHYRLVPADRISAAELAEYAAEKRKA